MNHTNQAQKIYDSYEAVLAHAISRGKYQLLKLYFSEFSKTRKGYVMSFTDVNGYTIIADTYEQSLCVMKNGKVKIGRFYDFQDTANQLGKRG